MFRHAASRRLLPRRFTLYCLLRYAADAADSMPLMIARADDMLSAAAHAFAPRRC